MNLNHFEKLATTLGKKQEYFQGAGGNVSLKMNNTMLIKASGIFVKDMISQEATVEVKYQDIREYFNQVQGEEMGKEKESENVIRNSVINFDGKRPSIETGFHTFLDSAVIHSHSVYANILTCSSDFYNLVKKIFKEGSITFITIGYTAPGYLLTHKVKNALRNKNHKNNCVIFMKNHGLIVSAATLDGAITLHEKVNSEIMAHFSIQEEYPISKLHHLESGVSLSATPFLKEFVVSHPDYFSNINNFLLFPDLIVFCKDMVVSDNNQKGKIVVNIKTGDIQYNTSKKEAHIIEENLVAWAYLLSTLKKKNLTPSFISKDNADIVENMESEKYRKNLVA